jgi:hypothetical protein
MSASRPARVRAAPARLHEEQASLHELAAAAAAESHPRPSALYEVQEISSSEEESDEEEHKGPASDEIAENNTWSNVYTPQQPKPFHARHYAAAAPIDCTTPLDFFRLFCPPSFLTLICDYTNTYAEQRHKADKENEEPHAAARKDSPAWTATDETEVAALLGCLIYMGIVCMDATRDYWSGDTKQSFVADTFSRDRFLQLQSHLRFNEESQLAAAERDPLHQLRKLTDHLHDASRKYFHPGKYQSLDEAMIAFKGRSHMRQHIAKKKSPTGFKVWTLVDCATNFVVAFDIYTGAKHQRKEENMSANVVLKLVSAGLSQKHHVIVMDGFFTSVHLLQKLLEVDQYALGTTRHNQKQFPRKTLLKEADKQARGEWKWRQHRESPAITVISWMDKKPVNLISSCTDPTSHAHIPRRRGREVHHVSCPAVLPLYTKYLRGVDVFSQRQSYSKIGRRSRKFFYSLIWFLLDVAIHNAYILYKAHHAAENGDEKAFRKQLMLQLVGSYSGRAKSNNNLKRSRDALHPIEHTQTQGVCALCRVRVGEGGHNRRSHWKCQDCQRHYCMPNCYNKHVTTLAQQAEDSDES